MEQNPPLDFANCLCMPACALGALAAVIALMRGERLLWLTLLGIAGNGAVLIPLLGLLLRD